MIYGFNQMALPVNLGTVNQTSLEVSSVSYLEISVTSCSSNSLVLFLSCLAFSAALKVKFKAMSFNTVVVSHDTISLISGSIKNVFRFIDVLI